MEEDRMPKNIFTQKLEGTRRRGRPRKRGKEEVERDQVLEVRRWRELVADRKKWKDIVRQAKAHSELYCQWKKKKYIARIVYFNIPPTEDFVIEFQTGGGSVPNPTVDVWPQHTVSPYLVLRGKRCRDVV